MSARTVFLSRLIGIYCILVALAMAINKQATVATVVALVHDAPTLFVFGLVVVAAGLAIVLTHNIWSGGVLTVIVTIIGWLTLIKGLVFLFVPPATAVGIVIWGSAYDQYFYLDMALALLLGIYLTYESFRLEKSS
jgi:hypothetical protein